MRNPDRQTTFRFRQFEVSNKLSAMKIGTDAVLLGAWAFEASGFGARSDLRALDIGCGTGVLSLMLAQRFAQWFTGLSVLGIDIDADAATEASANFSRSPWAARLEAFQVDFRSFAVSCEAATYDMIISNPPFFTGGAEAPDDARRIARHQESLGLHDLLVGAARLLAPEGLLAVVLPADKADEARTEARFARLELTRECIVGTTPRKPPRRILMEFRHSGIATATQRENLLIHTPEGSFSDRYSRLVEPFYLPKA